jgi:hypothetical protein
MFPLSTFPALHHPKSNLHHRPQANSPFRISNFAQATRHSGSAANPQSPIHNPTSAAGQFPISPSPFHKTIRQLKS